MQHGYVCGEGVGGGCVCMRACVCVFVCGRIADFISFVLNYPVKMK